MPAGLAAAARDAMPEAARRPDWLHEIKFDGYRTIAFVADGGRCG